jgi:hypothetical protein
MKRNRRIQVESSSEEISIRRPGIVQSRDDAELDGMEFCIVQNEMNGALRRRSGLSSYELNRQRNNRINGCNCRGIAVMFVQCILRTDDDAK